MKLLNKYDDYDPLYLVISGVSYAVHVSDCDRKDFCNYKLGDTEGLTNEKKREMDVLLLLENLGYPMDELGTYLYKNLIIEVIKYLDNVSTRQDIINCKYFLAKLKDFFSDIYLNLARFELEMGIKTFHKTILEAISNIDYSKADKNLIYEIYIKKRRCIFTMFKKGFLIIRDEELVTIEYMCHEIIKYAEINKLKCEFVEMSYLMIVKTEGV